MAGLGLIMLLVAGTVGATVALLVRLIQSVVERVTGRSFSRSVGWFAVCGWGLGFATAAFAVAAVTSIGLFVLAVAIILLAGAAWICRAFPEAAIGAALGSGAVVLIIGLMNLSHDGGFIIATSALPLAFGLIWLHTQLKTRPVRVQPNGTSLPR